MVGWVGENEGGVRGGGRDLQGSTWQLSWQKRASMWASWVSVQPCKKHQGVWGGGVLKRGGGGEYYTVTAFWRVARGGRGGGVAFRPAPVCCYGGNTAAVWGSC